MKRISWIAAAFAIGGASCAAPAFAAETVTYSYDARGRLVKVVRSGGPNGTKTTDYTLDKADNRTGKTTS